MCVTCGLKIEPKVLLSSVCPKGCSSLAKNVFDSRRINFRELNGIWRYYDWLPVEETTGYDGKSVTYRSEHLGKELGLKSLFVSFSGYWPEMGAHVKTCTFKEFEAVVGIQHAKENGVSPLIVASAGSAANAFAYIGSLEKFSVVLVAPSRVTDGLVAPFVDEKFVKTVVVEGEYWDAISTAEKLHCLTGVAYDGGGRSPVRRDALATIVLEAVEKIGFIPDHYFQAVGSGTGAIAAFDMVERLRDDGRFGRLGFKLHLSQNDPFIPIVKAWKDKRREIRRSDVEAESPLDILYAKVLSNIRPLYGMKGGLFDALQATSGETYAITNKQAEEASEAFERLEGIDIHPAAAVAVASLIDSVNQGKVGPEETIMLNISGGGLKRAEKEIGLHGLPVTAKVEKEASSEELRNIIQ